MAKLKKKKASVVEMGTWRWEVSGRRERQLKKEE